MKHEMILASSLPAKMAATSTTASRRELRIRTDALIADGQIELVEGVERACQIMLTIGSILEAHQLDPHEGDLIEATCASIENGRAVMDKGLLVDSEVTTKCGAVMLEIAVRGMLASLGVPYDNVLAECHRARVAGEDPKVRELLEAAGLVQSRPPDAANDE